MQKNYQIGHLTDISGVRRQFLDLPYAQLSATQKLDLYLPEEGTGPFPVIIQIHGGAFRVGDKRDRQLEPALEALKRGYAVAAVNYRLSREARFPAHIQDIKAVIRWLRAHAQDYGLSGKVACWGGSAGGYLSAMLAVSAGIAELEDLTLGHAQQPSHIEAAVDWCGPTDFMLMDQHLAESNLGPQDHNEEDSPESLFLGQHLIHAAELSKKASPLTYVREQCAPILIQHGTCDFIVPFQQSQLLAAKIEAIAGRDSVVFEPLTGVGHHGDPAFETLQNVARILDYLDQYLK